MEGPPFVNHPKFQGGFWVAPVVGVSGMATTGRNVGGITENSLVSGRILTGNLVLSNDVYPTQLSALATLNSSISGLS